MGDERDEPVFDGADDATGNPSDTPGERAPWRVEGIRHGPPSSRTIRASWLALGWSGVLVLVGLLLLVVGTFAVSEPFLWKTMDETDYCENDDHPGPCTEMGEALLPGLVVLAVGTVHLGVSVGLRKGRRWARWIAVGVFSLWTIGTLATLVRPVGPEPVISRLVLAAYFAATVVLAGPEIDYPRLGRALVSKVRAIASPEGPNRD